ncbi:MAG: family 20 glycosylhydrolase [Candidatus Aminicenantes bacterium]|nr:MAG: family 20 glycosylhydrolase [Candidatus Aminicenantes bacterium]
MNFNIWPRLGLLLLCITFFLLSFCQTTKNSAEIQSRLNLMPWPADISVESGELRLDVGFRIEWKGYQESRLERAIERFHQRLGNLSGIPLALGENEDADRFLFEIACEGPGEKVQSLREDESYVLKVGPSRIDLNAPTPVGVLRGLETLLQLIEKDEKGYYMPSVRIQDKPRFPWRGLLIDACRHWMPMEVIKRNLDGMAAVKLNVLHWHLSEDQGFRVECLNFPRLHEMGSDGNFYTQKQIQEIIEYARDRGIRVVPEFDIPGHTTSWFVGYPEFASSPGPFAIERRWGVHDPCMDPTREETYAFLDTFIGEMAGLFTDAYFHIGGDEVNGKLWNSNPGIVAFKREQGMKDNHDLQAYFNRKILAIIQKHRKKMIGWDEIFHPDLPKDVVVHSWRGPKSLAEAARQGYMGILSNGYYLDHILSAVQHYGVEPLSGDAAELSDEEKERILGGEACMWAEFVTPETIDSRIWPRVAAVAERFWSPQEVTDVDSMYRRLEVLNRNLDSVGLQHNANYALMLQRLTGEQPIDTLKVLADIVEPVRYYTRPGTREYTQMTPLTRLVDAARPESQQARKFRDMVDEYLGDAPEFRANRETIREWLHKWRDNHEILKPVLTESPLLKEIIPLSEDIAALAEAGIQVMEYIENGQETPLSLMDEVLPLLKPVPKPKHELLIMITPGIEKLIENARPPLVFDDFEDGESQGWEPNIPENWQIGEERGTKIYKLTAPGVNGEIRAPTSWSLLKEYDVSSFILTGRLKSASPVDNPHRDMIIVFHYQDPTHFYYVHLSAVSDELHNIIGLVNGADRVKINKEPPGESVARLMDMRFHEFKVTCNTETGEIKVYFDDMSTPILTAKDTSLDHGFVGVGSFDDTGSFDDIQLWGKIHEQ